MKIGIDIRLIGKKQTGSEAVFFNLIKNLALIDENNSYKLFTGITGKEALERIKKDLGIKNKNNFEIIPIAAKNRFIWNSWSLSRYLRKNPVDIYLTQYITPWFVPKKIKIYTIIHDISFNFYPQFIKKSDLIFLKILIPISLRRADKILGVSRFTRDEIIKYYGVNPKKVGWFHNAVSEDFLRQDYSAEKIAETREKYNLPEKFILYIGTLQPRKNLPVLIQAFEILANKYGKDIKLAIAGGKGRNYDKRIDRMVKKNKLEDQIIFTGFIDEEDKAAVMKAAEIFIYPSLYEGFGIPILEAMSLGVPVIASDIAPHREIAGAAAVFFNPYQPEILAKEIKIMLSDDGKRQEFSEIGKKQAQQFSWINAARKLLETFASND